MTITPCDLRSALEYCPLTGVLTWKPRPLSHFKTAAAHKAWNSRFAGKMAFTAKNSMGYHHGSFRGRFLLAHRVAWVIKTGEWPEAEIDHIDRDQSNNAFRNLRSCSRSGNCMNRASKAGESGLVGVSRQKGRKKWLATCQVNGKKHYLGSFFSAAEAAAVRDDFARRHHGAFAQLNGARG